MTKAAAALLGFGAAFSAHAQSPAPLPEPRLYGGLQASYMAYPGLNAGLGGDLPAFGGIGPAAATVGFRAFPSASIELTGTGRFPTTQRTVANGYISEYRSWATAVALLARRRLTQPVASSPWAVELSTGFVRLVAEQELITYQQNGPSQDPLSRTRKGTSDLQFAMGLGTSYRLSPHWQLTAEAQGQLSMIGFIVSTVFGSQATSTVGGGLAAGVRYRF